MMNSSPAVVVLEGMDPEVRVTRQGRVGRLTLDRPRAINALTHSMVNALAEALERFAADDDIAVVVIDGAGDRGFCAGGDIVALTDSAKAADGEAQAFWADEYRLNARIGRFPKPVVALMDGIVMGGGVGLGGHAAVRLVTERTTLAMPEVGIGFIPDVGGTWLLAKAPGELGTHLGLTAGRAKAADCLLLDMADHHVPSEQLDALLAALVVSDLPAAQVVASFATEPAPGVLAAHRSWIDACYTADRVSEIVARLRAHGEPEAAAAADEIELRSPSSLVVTLAGLRRARALPSLEHALDQEFRMASRVIDHADFIEGVRAQVIDKDRNPSWSPATVAEAEASLPIEGYFADLGEGELGLGR